MGLDISFNRIKAVESGLTFMVTPNASAESIAREEAEPDNDPDYLAWLKGSENCVVVPNSHGLLVADEGINEYIVVRANKWGRVYEPLTNWLTAHGIPWDEF